MTTVLALTRDTPFLTALGLAAGWEIRVVPDLEALLADPAPTVLIDLGSTDAGLAAATEVRAEHPETDILVLGDHVPDGPSGFEVLARPFNLEELDLALRELGRATPSRPVVPAVEEEPATPSLAVDVPRPRPMAAPSEVWPQRLRRIAVVAEDLLELVATLPSLHDPRNVAEALVAELVETLRPDAVAIWVPGPDGHFHALASHGLTPMEEERILPADHPLLRTLTADGGAVHFPSLERAQGLIAGVGGARTPAMMAAAVEAPRTTRAGVVTVGGRRFHDGDLDRLVTLAGEAALGFALASLLARLRTDAPYADDVTAVTGPVA